MNRLNDVPAKARRAIYETAWRVYTASNSSEYATERALDTAWEYQVRASVSREIIREALEDVNAEVRKLLSRLAKEAEERSKKYAAHFPAPGYEKE